MNKNSISSSRSTEGTNTSNGSFLSVSPLLSNFAKRVWTSISVSTSSFASFLHQNSPGSKPTDSVEDLKDTKFDYPSKSYASPFRGLIEFRRKTRPSLPFCEAYDGVNMRKTKTISDSIIQLLDSRWEKGETEIRKKYSSKAIVANDMASDYFCRMQEFNDMKENSKEWRSDDIFYFDGETYAENLGEIDQSLMRSKRSLFASKYKITKVPSKEYLSLIEDRGIEEASVDLKIRYDLKTESIQVTIFKVEDVTNLKDNNKRIRCFVQLSMYRGSGDRKQKTKTSKRCRDPVFNQTFKIGNIMKKWLHVECLHVQLFWKKRFGNVRIGEAFVWLDDFDISDKDGVSITERFNPCY